MNAVDHLPVGMGVKALVHAFESSGNCPVDEKATAISKRVLDQGSSTNSCKQASQIRDYKEINLSLCAKLEEEGYSRALIKGVLKSHDIFAQVRDGSKPLQPYVSEIRAKGNKEYNKGIYKQLKNEFSAFLILKAFNELGIDTGALDSGASFLTEDQIELVKQKSLELSTKQHHGSTPPPVGTLPKESKEEKGKAVASLKRPLEPRNSCENITPERKERYVTSISQKIKGLALSSFSFRADVIDILQEIQRFKHLPGTDQNEFSHLEKALNRLKDPETLNISLEEERVMGMLYKKLGVEDQFTGSAYADLQRSTVREAQSDIIKALKKGVAEGKALESTASHALSGLKQGVVQKRMKQFIEQHPIPLVNDKCIHHLPSLVRKLEGLTRNVIVKELKETWENLQSQYDFCTDGKFSSLLEYYSFCNPTCDFPLFIEHCQDEFLDKLHWSDFQSVDDDGFSCYLAGRADECAGRAKALFMENYGDHYEKRHLWIMKNSHRIKQPYNQGDNPNTNLGRGTCYTNSLARYKKLLENPTLSYEDIKMGSDAYGRYRQSRKSREGQTPNVDLSDYGLKMNGDQWIAVSADTTADLEGLLVEAISEWSRVGHKQAVLCARPDNMGSGHAVNLQFDEQEGAFCLMDDNVGLIEFDNLENMQIELVQYLKAFYPDKYQHYCLESYVKENW